MEPERLFPEVPIRSEDCIVSSHCICHLESFEREEKSDSHRGQTRRERAFVELLHEKQLESATNSIQDSTVAVMTGNQRFSADAKRVIGTTSSAESSGNSSGAICDVKPSTCPICLEVLHGDSLMRIVQARCSHNFHEPCIRKALQQQDRCPICRVEAPLRDASPSATHAGRIPPTVTAHQRGLHDEYGLAFPV